jgi:hypothetical protein
MAEVQFYGVVAMRTGLSANCPFLFTIAASTKAAMTSGLDLDGSWLGGIVLY